MRIRLQIALLALTACPSSQTIHGQEIGSFTFSAVPVSNDCNFEAIPPIGADGGFTFDAILSRDPESTQAFMRVGNVERDAGFDGQIFISEASAPRHFVECGTNCDSVLVVETVRIILLSSSQDSALGGHCPPNPLDGGVPVATPDGGISPPCPTADPCDVVRACGELIDVVSPDGGSCQCLACTISSAVEGQRKASQ